jgi:hypothetical protein
MIQSLFTSPWTTRQEFFDRLGTALGTPIQTYNAGKRGVQGDFSINDLQMIAAATGDPYAYTDPSMGQYVPAQYRSQTLEQLFPGYSISGGEAVFGGGEGGLSGFTPFTFNSAVMPDPAQTNRHAGRWSGTLDPQTGKISGLQWINQSTTGGFLPDLLTDYGWAIPLAFAGAGAAGLLGGSGGAGAAAGAYVSPEIAGMAAQTIPAAGTSSTGLLGGLGGIMDGIAPALPSGTGFGLTGGTGLSGGTIMGDALLTGGGLAPGIATATAGGSNMGWLSNAFDWITGDTGSNLLGRLGSSAIQGLFANNTANRNIDAARDSLTAQMALGNRALDEARFKPVNITSNLGSTSWEIGPDGKPTAATANLSPQMQQLIAQAMGKGLDTLGGINAGTPEQLAQAEFQRYLDYARPKQNDLFSSLQNRMSAQGVLGFGVGDTNATSYNPLYRDFASGIADSDYAAYKQSQTLAQDLTNNTLKRALTLFGAGTEADAYGTNLLKLSGELGGRNVNAAGANALLTAGTAGNQSLLSATQAGNAAVGSIFGNAAQQMGPLLTAILGGLK